MDYDPRREFAEFREQFITAAKLTRTVHDVLVDQTLEDILANIQEIPTKTDLANLIALLKKDLLDAINGDKSNHKEFLVSPKVKIIKHESRETDLKSLSTFRLNETKLLLSSLIGDKRVENEEEAVKQIQELTGGLPLAIFIIGSALANLPLKNISEFVGNLKNERIRLSHQKYSNVNLDVRTSLLLTYKELTESQQRLFVSLGSFRSDDLSILDIYKQNKQAKEEFLDDISALIKFGFIRYVDPYTLAIHPLVYSYASELATNNDLDTNSEPVEKDINKQEISRTIVWEGGSINASSYPSTLFFVGQEDALENIAKGIASSNVIMIGGMAGIGKTYIVAHFVETQSENTTVLWQDCASSNQLEQVLVSLSEFFKTQFDDTELWQLLRNPLANEQHKLDVVAKAIDKHHGYLIWDNFDAKANQSLLPLLLTLNKMLRQGKLIDAYHRLGRYDDAINAISYCVFIDRKLNFQDKLASSLFQLGVNLCLVRKYEDAEQNLAESLRLIKNRNLGNEAETSTVEWLIVANWYLHRFEFAVELILEDILEHRRDKGFVGKHIVIQENDLLIQNQTDRPEFTKINGDMLHLLVLPKEFSFQDVKQWNENVVKRRPELASAYNPVLLHNKTDE